MRALSKAERAGLRVALYAAAACVIAFLQQSRSVLGQPASAQGSTTVDVAVMDGSGAPAAGLSSGDFRVTVDGRSREVLSTEFLTTSSPGAAAQDRSTDRGNDAATSVATAGRSIYMVLDRSSIFAGNERALTNAAAAIIDRLAPADRAALITLPEPGPRVGLTAAATEVEEALGRVKGSRSPELANFATGIGEALSIAEGDTFALTSVADRECRDVPALRTRIDQGVRTSAPDARTECVRRITRNVETMVLQAEQASSAGVRRRAGPSQRTARRVRSENRRDRHGRPGHPSIRRRLRRSRRSCQHRPREPLGAHLHRRLDEISQMGAGDALFVPPRSDDPIERFMRATTGWYQVTFAGMPRDDRESLGRLRVEVAGRGLTVRHRPTLGPVPGRPAPA